jgi:hypothetical protein
MNSTTKTAAMFAEEINQSNENSDTRKEDIKHTKARLGTYLKKKWGNKAMNDQYIRSIHREIISDEDMFLWLLREALKEETESARTPAQDQALDTKYHVTQILQTDSKFSICQQFSERVEHININMPSIGRTIHKET